MAVFRRVQQRTAVKMPYVYEEDYTVLADDAARIQRRHPPLAGQSETDQRFPLAESVQRRDDVSKTLSPMGVVEK
eukprot:1381013-Prorocentrum_lima.AAC.1